MKRDDFLSKMSELLDMTKQACAEFAAAAEESARADRQQILAIDESSADETKLQLDKALLRAAPVVVVPAHCEFSPLQENGHRLAVASDGMWLEVRRPWLYFLQRVAEMKSVAVPYGQLEPKVEFAFGRLGTALPQLQEFALHAIATAPVEAAASVIWNHVTDSWRIAYPEVQDASASHIRYNQVPLADGEHLVIDLHSHGNGPAFFSGTDDADDAGSVKISGVLGSLDQSPPTAAFRLCVLGLTVNLQVPVDRIFA